MTALEWLDKAIARHERHMSGKESTSEKSQMQMMTEMKQARAALVKEEADESTEEGAEAKEEDSETKGPQDFATRRKMALAAHELLRKG